MDPTELNKVIAKVRKLYDLAASTNEHEAANAVAAAEQLMQQYRLSQAEVEARSDDGSESPSEDADPMEVGGRIPIWLQLLIQALATHYSCVVWYQIQYTSYCRVINWRVVGCPTDVQLMRLQYNKIKDQVNRLTALKGGDRSFSDGYRKGLVITVRERLVSMCKQVRKAATTQAIVKLDERHEAAEKTLAYLHPDLKTTSGPRFRVNAHAYDQGRRDGHKINFGEDLRAAAKSKQLAGRVQ